MKEGWGDGRCGGRPACKPCLTIRLAFQGLRCTRFQSPGLRFLSSTRTQRFVNALGALCALSRAPHLLPDP